MRIIKAALAISITSVLFLTGCGAEDPVQKDSEEVAKTAPHKEEGEPKKKIAAEDEAKKAKKHKTEAFVENKKLNLSAEEQEDARVCSNLRDEMTEMMLVSAEGATDLPSMFGDFTESDEFIQIAQEALDPDITQEAEDFILMMKAFSAYVNLGGSMDNLESPENLKLFEEAIMGLEGDEIFRMLEISQEVLVEQKEAGDEQVAYEPFQTCAALGVPFSEAAGSNPIL